MAAAEMRVMMMERQHIAPWQKNRMSAEQVATYRNAIAPLQQRFVAAKHARIEIFKSIKGPACAAQG